MCGVPVPFILSYMTTFRFAINISRVGLQGETIDAIFFIHCYLETFNIFSHIASGVFGCVSEGCVFLLSCCQCFIC